MGNRAGAWVASLAALAVALLATGGIVLVQRDDTAAGPLDASSALTGDASAPDASPSPSTSTPASRPPTGPAVHAEDGLAALYARLGLDVPTHAIAKEDRPGCPPSPSSGGGGGGGGGPILLDRPTVPEDELPTPLGLTDFTPDTSVIEGHGMWIWQYSKTEDNHHQRMVDKAVEAGFDHLWVRVGDSKNGFYAKKYLDPLVPLAHAAGLKVIGWGFPFLHDPEYDTAWTNEVLDWVGPHGRGLDAYSPDIERETEGTLLTPLRIDVHLAAVRAAHPDRTIIATVYPAADWVMESGYPYETIAQYVDAFATMDYWTCGDSGLRPAHSIRRLSHLRPVHVIGQATSGGRDAHPSDRETWRFLDTAVREGALGASWWVWQFVSDDQWDAIARYPWHDAVASNARNPQPANIPEG